jgi:GGDEF domain-containing protein
VTRGTHATPLDAAQAELLTRATRAARELCELLWEALHQELRSPRAERVRELSQRLAEVSSTVALLTHRPDGDEGPLERRAPTTPVGEPAGSASGTASGGPVAAAPAVPAPATPAPVSPLTPVPDPSGPHPAAAQSEPPPVREPDADAARAARIRLVDELEPQDASSVAVEVERPVGGLRPQEGASAWVGTVGRLLERHAVDGLPFAVLLVEVVDVAHIERSESPVQVNNLIAQVEGALGRALRSHDTLTRESLGRYWLVAPETNGTGARMLAERLARLVRSSASHRGVPLEVAVGIAVCPEDGLEAPELAARADLSVYSARATGQPVARTEPPL